MTPTQKRLADDLGRAMDVALPQCKAEAFACSVIAGCERINTQQPTPTPWHANGTQIIGKAGKRTQYIADVSRDNGATIALANAALICRAVNSHAELIEVCKALQKVIRDTYADGKNDWVEAHSDAYEQASTIILRPKGGNRENRNQITLDIGN